MKVVASNRRARFDFEITDTLEAGIILTGQEVKSCRQGHIDLRGSYVTFLGGKPVLKQAKISKYTYASMIPDYNPSQDRMLLLKKNEVEKLTVLTQQKGITVVPLEVRSGHHIKVLLGVARGRKTVDKRQRIKERETEKRMRQGNA